MTAEDLEVRDRRLLDVTGAEVKIEQLATGIGFGEGPVWDVAGKRLIFSDMKHDHIRVFDVKADRTTAGGPVWAELTGDGEGRPDGMKFDGAGNLYCTGPGGVHVLDARAHCLGVIRTPERLTNIAWGDDDLKTLYMTGVTALYRVRVKVPGRLTY
jgi:gluconolactonase